MCRTISKRASQYELRALTAPWSASSRVPEISILCCSSLSWLQIGSVCTRSVSICSTSSRRLMLVSPLVGGDEHDRPAPGVARRPRSLAFADNVVLRKRRAREARFAGRARRLAERRPRLRLRARVRARSAAARYRSEGAAALRPRGRQAPSEHYLLLGRQRVRRRRGRPASAVAYSSPSSIGHKRRAATHSWPIGGRVSAKAPARRGGDWGGNTPAWSRPPFENGNRAALKHGVYLEKFNEAERAEIDEIAIPSARQCRSTASPSSRASRRPPRGSSAGAAPTATSQNAARTGAVRSCATLNVLDRSLQRDLSDL